MRSPKLRVLSFVRALADAETSAHRGLSRPDMDAVSLRLAVPWLPLAGEL